MIDYARDGSITTKTRSTVLVVFDRNPQRMFREFGLSPVMVTRIKANAHLRIWITS